MRGVIVERGLLIGVIEEGSLKGESLRVGGPPTLKPWGPSGGARKKAPGPQGQVFRTGVPRGPGSYGAFSLTLLEDPLDSCMGPSGDGRGDGGQEGRKGA